MKKTAHEPKVTDNPLYHDTWMLLRKYRDVVWSLELSVQQVRRQFQIEYGSSIEEFLESLYVAGVTFEGSSIEDHARCIERSYKMLKLLDTSVGAAADEAQVWRELLLAAVLHLSVTAAVGEHAGNHRKAGAAHSGHQLPHLLPQASDGD